MFSVSSVLDEIHLCWNGIITNLIVTRPSKNDRLPKNHRSPPHFCTWSSSQWWLGICYKSIEFSRVAETFSRHHQAFSDKTLATRSSQPWIMFSVSRRFKRAPVDYLTFWINCYTPDNCHAAKRATGCPDPRIRATQPPFTSLSAINYRKLKHRGNHCSWHFRDENQGFLKSIETSFLLTCPTPCYLSRAWQQPGGSTE